jgi:hypothetical protein
VKLWKTLKAAVPGPLVFLIGQWLKLFVSTDLAYPTWAKQAQDTSLALGVVAVAIMSLAVSEWPKRWLKIGTWLLLAAAAGFVFYYMVIIADRLDPALAPSELEVSRQHRLWYLSFIASMVLFMMGIAMGVLSQPDPPPGSWAAMTWRQKLIWIAAGIAAGSVLLVGLAFAVKGLLNT